MSGFSESIMRERLQRLTNTTHSIQTLSLWLIHHQKKHANVILNTWLLEVKGHTGSDRLISLMNLANDVIQNCRKKHPEFMKSFLDVLQPGFCHIANTGVEQCRKTVNRILQVWKEREIYSKEELNTLQQCLDGIDGLNSPIVSFDSIDIKTPPLGDETATTSTENAQKGKLEFKNFLKNSTNLINVLRKIEDPPSADAKIRQLIAAYPESIANPTLLKQIVTTEAAEELMEKINEAYPIVNAYCAKLKAEMIDRRTAQKLLDEYLIALNESAERNANLISSVKKKIARLDEEKKNISKHIESLPDLSEMFNENASVLPSLGELFT